MWPAFGLAIFVWNVFSDSATASVFWEHKCLYRLGKCLICSSFVFWRIATRSDLLFLCGKPVKGFLIWLFNWCVYRKSKKIRKIARRDLGRKFVIFLCSPNSEIAGWKFRYGPVIVIILSDYTVVTWEWKICCAVIFEMQFRLAKKQI